ncbi:hypothetical protein C8024_18505 [Sphingopyxis sp. BSNA05]|nr:hypothetical protein [Sphingopyxis sp. BSNA05]
MFGKQGLVSRKERKCQMSFRKIDLTGLTWDVTFGQSGKRSYFPRPDFLPVQTATSSPRTDPRAVSCGAFTPGAPQVSLSSIWKMI